VVQVQGPLAWWPKRFLGRIPSGFGRGDPLLWPERWPKNTPRPRAQAPPTLPSPAGLLPASVPAPKSRGRTAHHPGTRWCLRTPPCTAPPGQAAEPRLGCRREWQLGLPPRRGVRGQTWPAVKRLKKSRWARVRHRQEVSRNLSFPQLLKRSPQKPCGIRLSAGIDQTWVCRPCLATD
jgi:hypothetical protein